MLYGPELLCVRGTHLCQDVIHHYPSYMLYLVTFFPSIRHRAVAPITSTAEHVSGSRSPPALPCRGLIDESSVSPVSQILGPGVRPECKKPRRLPLQLARTLGPEQWTGCADGLMRSRIPWPSFLLGVWRGWY